MGNAEKGGWLVPAQKKKGLQSAFSFDEFGPYLDNTCQLKLCQEGWIFEIFGQRS